MGSATSNKQSNQDDTSKFSSDSHVSKKKISTRKVIIAPEPKMKRFCLRDDQSLALIMPFFDSGMILNFSAAFPQMTERLCTRFVQARGKHPFRGIERSCANHSGVFGSFSQPWVDLDNSTVDSQMNPEMRLIHQLVQFAKLTKTPSRYASLSYFEREVKASNSDDELEDKEVPEQATSHTDEFDEPENSTLNLEKAWKSGVGYGSEYTGDLQDWDVKGWSRNCKAAEGQIVKILEQIVSLVSEEEYSFEFISESSLLPGLVQYCQNDSYHDISSRSELYTSVFKCIKKFLQNPKFLPLLFEFHGSTVAEGVARIGKQAENVVKFEDDAELPCLITNVYNDLKKSIDVCITSLNLSLALVKDSKVDIQPLLTNLKAIRENLDAVSHDPTFFKKMQDASFADYEEIMRELCFDSIEEMTEFRSHKYGKQSCLMKRKLIKRLAGEFADLPFSLPIHHESSIFFRVCEEKMSHAQMLIIPADGTPYGAGCFIFDIMFPQNYPNVPPKVNLATTGHGAVRFNPNLYNCGKVCLSLLGTWDAYSQGEKWNSEISTFLQVAISIQSLIFVSEPFYNEPGDEDSMGTEWGEQQSRAYNVIIQKGTTKYAMIEMLENPPAAWKDVILTHFKLQGDRALQNVTNWLGEDHVDTKKFSALLSNLRNESSEEKGENQRFDGA